MQIKTTLRYHFTPTRLKKVRSVGEDVEKLEPLCTIKMVQLLWDTVWCFLKKLKIELSYEPAIPLLGTYPKKNKTLT